MKKILFTFLLLPLITFAQAEGEITIGDKTVAYETVTENNGSTYYYQGDDLAASTNGSVWLVYKNGEVVLEAHDTDGDGEADAFLTLDANGEVLEMTGAGATTFARPEVVEFAELLNETELEGDGSEASIPDDEDLVGSLDSITIPSYHNYYLYAFFVLLIGGGVWWWRRRKNNN